MGSARMKWKARGEGEMGDWELGLRLENKRFDFKLCGIAGGSKTRKGQILPSTYVEMRWRDDDIITLTLKYSSRLVDKNI